MNFNDFAFVHYILITIIFFPSVKPTHGKRRLLGTEILNKKQREWDRPGKYGHKQTP